MARLARLVVAGLPHDVTQRGNGRARTFFGEADDALYRDLLAGSCRTLKPAKRGFKPASIGNGEGDEGLVSALST
jgi:hypothetical protein